MSIPKEFINLLLTKIDIVDLINTHIPLKKKSGNNYFARCPFHNEKSASFSVSQAKQFYHCFGCGVHGNAIDFMMQHERLSFPESIENLARQIGMDVPHTSFSNKKEDSLPALFELMEKVTHYYFKQMCHSNLAKNYLKNRGISGKIAKQFSLGYALPGWDHLLNQFGKTEDDKKKLLECGLIIKKEETHSHYDRFRDRIIFPIQDYRGRIIAFGGRIIEQGEPKYLNSPETLLFQKGHELYGLNQLLKANRKLTKILVVEGYMDVVALFQHDITYAVATLGTATTKHHIKRLWRYTTEIVFCFDGDEAGKKAAWRALQVIFPLMQDHFRIRFLFLPDQEDPDSLVRKEGKVAFEARLSSALSLSTFFLQTLSSQFDLNSMEGRAGFASEALTYIKQLPKCMFAEILLEELTKRTRINVKEIKQFGPTLKLNTKTMPDHHESATHPKLKPYLHTAIALLIQNPTLMNFITQPLPHINLPGYAILLQIIEIIKQNPQLTTATLIEHWRGQPEESFITNFALWQHAIPEAGIANEFLGALRQLNLFFIEQAINQLLTKAMQEQLSDEEKHTLSDWIKKKKEIQETTTKLSQQDFMTS